MSMNSVQMNFQVSDRIRMDLQERARDFHIILDDVAITDTQFSPLFTQVSS